MGVVGGLARRDLQTSRLLPVEEVLSGLEIYLQPLSPQKIRIYPRERLFQELPFSKVGVLQSLLCVCVCVQLRKF